ncbi:hypothetical protein [Yinghuangia seranimata]|uniref:hypothetical protein n=1 Tax=Yinghuangia seranimata TaxID=408067 RepID=UPI00248CE098|nr:hypothetical protein [Yinghuangia seranimata]MDI2129421.1 hypothetical protein [Yinghuangia seranimata]
MTDMSLLAAAGLTVIGPAEDGTLPTAEVAWRLLTGISVEPTLVVPDDGPDRDTVVDAAWLRLAREAELLDEHGEFLLAVPGAGASGWAHVRWTPAARLAENLTRTSGLHRYPEFLAMSLDSRVVCGATDEEDGIWIVRAQVPPQWTRPQEPHPDAIAMAGMTLRERVEFLRRRSGQTE